MQKFITCCHEFSNFHKRTPFFFLLCLDQGFQGFQPAAGQGSSLKNHQKMVIGDSPWIYLANLQSIQPSPLEFPLKNGTTRVSRGIPTVIYSQSLYMLYFCWGLIFIVHLQKCFPASVQSGGCPVQPQRNGGGTSGAVEIQFRNGRQMCIFRDTFDIIWQLWKITIHKEPIKNPCFIAILNYQKDPEGII